MLHVLKRRVRVQEVVQDIAKFACPEGELRVLEERTHLTQLDNMKDVAEHFRRTFSDWQEEEVG